MLEKEGWGAGKTGGMLSPALCCLQEGKKQDRYRHLLVGSLLCLSRFLRAPTAFTFTLSLCGQSPSRWPASLGDGEGGFTVLMSDVCFLRRKAGGIANATLAPAVWHRLRWGFCQEGGLGWE